MASGPPLSIHVVHAKHPYTGKGLGHGRGRGRGRERGERLTKNVFKFVFCYKGLFQLSTIKGKEKKIAY